MMKDALITAHMRQLQDMLTIENCIFDETIANIQNKIESYYDDLNKNCVLFDTAYFFDEIASNVDAINVFNRDVVNAFNKLTCALFDNK